MVCQPFTVFQGEIFFLPFVLAYPVTLIFIYFLKKGNSKRISGRICSLALDHESANNCEDSTDNTETPEDKRQH